MNLYLYWGTTYFRFFDCLFVFCFCFLQKKCSSCDGIKTFFFLRNHSWCFIAVLRVLRIYWWLSGWYCLHCSTLYREEAYYTLCAQTENVPTASVSGKKEIDKSLVNLCPYSVALVCVWENIMIHRSGKWRHIPLASAHKQVDGLEFTETHVCLFVVNTAQVTMGLCKCPKRKVTNLFCFEHRVNVCEHCLVSNHNKVSGWKSITRFCT